nr:disks large homolog 5 isoform X2 [Parasteatoda tepidariorum]
MDEEHKELLKFHRTRFLQCVDIDRLIPLLQTNGVLTNDDVTDLKKYNNSGAKAEKLLDLLPSKGSQAFQAFCLALETTYPHLLTVMFLGGNKKMSGLGDDVIRNSPSSAPQSLCSHQDIDLSQNIKTDIHLVNSERDGWRRSHSKGDRDNSYRRLTTSGDSMISSLSTLSKNTGVSTSDHSLNSRDYDSLHQVNDTHRYTTNEFIHKQEISLRDTDFYHPKPKASTLKMEDQRHETIILKKQYNELLADKHRLEQEIERLKRFREEDRKEVNELQRQQELLTENGGDAAHQLYLNAVRKCEAMKEEYDSLHKRYADLMASHSATISKLEVTQEELSCWRKRYEDLVHERNAALHERNGLQQQCTAAIRQWDNALRERNEAREQLAKVQQQRDEAMKEINQAMAVRIKATKDLARLTEERNAAVQEYSLIMSERDTVHKEMERLQEELTEAQKRAKSSEGTNKATTEEVETLRREISSALQDRDRALKECNDLREKYGDYVTGREESPRNKDRRKCEPHWDSVGRDISRKERDNQWENTHDNMIKTHGQWLDDLDQANSEIESLRHQVEKLNTELNEAQQEAEVCKRRRDWAFSERDKIVLERESIRSLCDKLRKERDRAVSDLAEALRDSDDVKKQKNEASKELKELREKIEAQLEKESRMKQLNSVGNNHSRDSAIDADMQEWDTETVEVAIDDLGLELGGGKGEGQNDNHLYIRSITKGSRAEGKLKINDCIMKINNVDVSNMDRKNAIEAIRNCSGNALLVIKRRRLTNSRGVSNVILGVHGGKHHGLAIENGIYISRITPGSVAAREGSIAVGDRLLSVNGKSVESVKTVGDMLDLANSTLTLQVAKCIPCPNSPPSSVSSYQNSDILSDKKKGSTSNSFGRDSIPSSPEKEALQISPKKPTLYEHEGSKSLKSNTVQSDHSRKSPDSSPLSPITRRRKAASDDRTRYPSSQPTLLDRAYNKIFGEKRTSKDKKNSPTTQSPLLGHDEEDPIAELDSVLEVHSRMLNKGSKERKPDKNGGTWPKYKGPLIQYNEVGTVSRCPNRKKSERKSLAAVNKQFSLYDPSMQCNSKQSSESHPNHLLDDCSDNENSGLSVSMQSDRISVFVDCQHGHQTSNFSKKSSIPIISPSACTTQTSSSGSSYASPEITSPHKTISGQSNEQLTDIRPPSYNGNSSASSLLDYSVVSAYPNKDVLEFYKNRNRSRPRSALFGVSDSDCLSSLESNASSQCSKNMLSLGVDRTSFSHSDGIPLSFSSPDRPLSAHSAHMYPVTVPTSLTASVISPSLLRSSTPFYTLNTGQRGITHSHHTHNHTTSTHGNALVVSPLPSAARYSSPPGLSVYTSRSGDSLLSVSVTESMLVDRSFHTHPDSGRYSLKDSGRHSFSPSPSPCPSHYSYSNPSPTQSIDLHYHHSSSCQTPKRVVPAHAHVHTVYRDDSYSPSVADGLLTCHKRNQRIRIPSNPSVTSKSSAGKVSSSSIEKASSVSERSSPLPPFTVEWLNPDGSQASVEYRGRTPKPGDTRSICIEKSTEPLGIQISCGEDKAGIFVSSVTKNSLADQAGLQIGDHLLEVCGINMRSATYGLAANVLRQCMDSITMLVQYNPEKYKEVVPENEYSSDAISPCETPVLHHKLSHSKSIDVSNEDVPSTPSSAASTLTKKKAHSLSSGNRMKNSKTSITEPRLVILKKSTSNLGISLLGGNAVGIFIHAVQEDSPAQGPNGLRTGDQILEYNGIDLRHATAEEAAYELAKPADTVKILALHNYERYQEIQDQPGDSFYIRSTFDRLSINGSLAFQKDDILYVDNTMYNGVPGLWQAWLVDEEGEKIKCGFIPSKYKAEEELMMKRSLGDLDGTDGGRRGSTAARRSFFRRKRHHRSNSRDSKELASFSDVSINSCSDSGILGEELVPLTYQRVEKQHYLSLRPVIIVGPLMEAVVDQLEQDFPHVFQRCIPEKMKGSLSMMERGLQELKFVDFRRRGNHFECTTVAAIKQLCDKKCHALLDCSLSAVERLNQSMIYPIVIFLKYKSTKQIREAKDSRYLTEKVTTKAAKEMFEHALKIESEYKQLINGVIPGSNLAYMCTQVKACVEEEQSKALWVPSGSL